MKRIVDTGERGSSLLEVAIVVVAIVILAAIGVPQMSEGSRSDNSSVGADLAALRNAIDQYSAEHGGAFPTTADIVDQLTKYTDIAGGVSETKTATHVYGPYIRSIPALPVGPDNHRGNSGIASGDADGVGWIYTETSGWIKANTNAARDDQDRLYSEY